MKNKVYLVVNTDTGQINGCFADEDAADKYKGRSWNYVVQEIAVEGGSVAAPKEHSEKQSELEYEWEQGYKIGKHESDNDIELLKESMINLIAIATEITLHYGPNSERRIGIEKAISRAKALLDKQ